VMLSYQNVSRVMIEQFEDPFFIWENGKCYVDLNSGAGAFFFGYPDKEQRLLLEGTNLFDFPIVRELIGKLEELTGYCCPILLTSGSEANEAALKLALRIQGPDTKIAYETGCYFGRTGMAVMCSDDKRYNTFMPSNWKDTFRSSAQFDPSKSGIFITEPLPSNSLDWNLDQLMLMVQKCHANGALVIDDETKCAFRTGELFAGSCLMPDIITVSKSLASGFPLSAVLVKKELASFCNDDWYSTTSGGHPQGCQIALANLRHITDLAISKDFEKRFSGPLGRLFGDRVRICGRYISIANIDGWGFAKFCKSLEYVIYGRTHFVSFFPQLGMRMETFNLFIALLENTDSWRKFLR